LVEETSTARKEDIDKLAETLRTIKEDERFMKIFRLKDATEKIKFILTLHAKRSEELISKQLLSRGKRLGVTVLTTSCKKISEINLDQWIF
jgi:glycine cleavage system protein P-like pyridoxal-binding family